MALISVSRPESLAGSRLTGGVPEPISGVFTMKRWAGILVAVLAVTVTADLAMAQRRPGGEGGRPGEGGQAGRPSGEGGRGGRPGEGGGRGGRPGEGGPGGGRGFSFPPSPIQTALDADKDGVISAKEIENAVAALRTLDKNKDGKLDRDELRPARPSFGGGRPGGGGPGAGGPSNRTSMVDRLLAYDKNKDGKISKEEAPEFLKQRFSSLDTDKNGSIEKKEIEAMVARFSNRGGRGGSSGRPGGAGGRPGEGGRPGGEGGRPRRPGGEGGGRPERSEGGGERPRRPSGDDA